MEEENGWIKGYLPLQILSGSSDGTVRLWSLGQQRCIETFHVHDEGVWALAVSEDFNTFYSSGRDKRVCMTELSEGEGGRGKIFVKSNSSGEKKCPKWGMGTSKCFKGPFFAGNVVLETSVCRLLSVRE